MLRRTMYRHEAALTVATVLLFALLTAALSLHGAGGRRFLAARTAVTVASPDDAYGVWKEAGVRGRVLLLFDRYPHFTSYYQDYLRGARDGVNFVQLAVFENIVRKLYFVVPEADWEDFRRHANVYRPFRDVPGAPKAMYLHNGSGVAFIASAPSSLPRIPEEALVYVNGDLFDPRETAELLASKGIASDLMVVLEKGAMK